MKRARLRPRVARTVAVFLGVACALAAAELGCRSLSGESLGFVYAHGVFTRPPEFREDPRRNALGFHDVEPPAPAAGMARVLLLGDSYVAALSVPLEATVGRRLEEALARDGDAAVRVVSAGQPGWGQAEQLEVLRALGPLARPALVLTLLLPFNDIRDNLPALDAAANDELAQLARYRPGWLRLRREEAPLFFCEGSRLNQWLSFQAAQRSERASRGGPAPLDYAVYDVDPRGLWEEAWRRTEALLLETAAVARGLGARYALAIASTPHGVLGAAEGLERLRASYPALRGLDLDLRGPTRRIESFCRAHGIPCLDLEAPFAAAQARGAGPLHWPRDGHWNLAGNALAGELLAPFARAELRAAPPR